MKTRRGKSFLLAVSIAACALLISCVRDPLKGPDGIDVDLTRLSSGLVYSTVSDIMENPGDYVGKTFRMKGSFSAFSTDKRSYFSCIVQDAAACCANGIEFAVRDQLSYPDDYPDIGDEITVLGVFDKYDDDGFVCYRLKDAEMTVTDGE